MANPSEHPIRLVLTRRLPEPVMALFDRGFIAWCNGDDRTLMRPNCSMRLVITVLTCCSSWPWTGLTRT